ncbi:hypothetical protein CSC03_2750 [Enterobacter hormaechei]|jgi:hypothetical protein|nr:hypothetical protein CSC02_4225 [Enterobacter hormaechei subsp. hoffmannii]PRW25011.1 hypothetical protein CSC03_2750 [Enterobacter hormaechei]RAL73231.1 hypothetical protein CSC35_1713 [Enterobacter hormaechei]
MQLRRKDNRKRAKFLLLPVILQVAAKRAAALVTDAIYHKRFF